MDAKLKSETVGKLLHLLLWPGLVLSVYDIGSTSVFGAATAWYIDNLYPIDGFLSICNYVLYILTAIVFLVWLYRLHMDLNALYPSLTRSPGIVLASFIVPFWNFFGIARTFHIVGQTYRHERPGIPVKEAQPSKDDNRLGRIGARMVAVNPLLFITLFGTSLLSRWVQRQDDAPFSSLLALSVLDAGKYAVFMILYYGASQGLKLAAEQAQERVRWLEATLAAEPEAAAGHATPPDGTENSQKLP